MSVHSIPHQVGDVSLGMDGLSELTASLFNFVGKEIFDYTKHSMLDDFQQAMTRYAPKVIKHYFFKLII